jgi:hypothetical protein
MTADEKVISTRLDLLNMAEKLGNVSQACKLMGYSRDSFYRFKKLYQEEGMAGLQEISRKKPILKNRVNPAIEAAIVKMAIDFPGFGQLRVSNELKKIGVHVSPGGVRAVWIRNQLETFQKRLKTLEAKIVAEDLLLTESQAQSLEKAKEEKVAKGEIKTEHPGYLGIQDTYYVGTIKGLGRIYQQTFIDTYTKLVFAQLYDRKNAIVATEMLNDRVLPFFEQLGFRLLRVLTDRGTEYCGALEHHAFESYLAAKNIFHSKTKTVYPETNGISDRFHKIIQDEFYRGTIRNKNYSNLDELQKDLDIWMKIYNQEKIQINKNYSGITL